MQCKSLPTVVLFLMLWTIDLSQTFFFFGLQISLQSYVGVRSQLCRLLDKTNWNAIKKEREKKWEEELFFYDILSHPKDGLEGKKEQICIAFFFFWRKNKGLALNFVWLLEGFRLKDLVQTQKLEVLKTAELKVKVKWKIK